MRRPYGYHSREHVPLPLKVSRLVDRYCDPQMDYKLSDDGMFIPDASSHGLKGIFDSAYRSVEHRIPALSYLIRLALEQPKRQGRVRQLRKGRLDGGRLHKVLTAETNKVFQRSARKNKLDIAVSLCMDWSRSMVAGCRSQLAAFHTAIVFAEALHSVGVPFEIIYPDFGNYHVLDDTENGRVPCTIVVLKQLDEQWPEVKYRLAYYQEYKANSNYLNHDVMAHAVARLKAQARSKNLLIIDFTDGAPEYGGTAFLTDKDVCVQDQGNRVALQLRGSQAAAHRVIPIINRDASTFCVRIDVAGDDSMWGRYLLGYKWVADYRSDHLASIDDFNRQVRKRIAQCLNGGVAV